MVNSKEGFTEDLFGIVGEETEVVFCLFDGMRELCTTVFDAIIILAEVTSLHYFVEEELAFFLVRRAKEIYVWHGEDGLEDVHHRPQRTSSCRTPKRI